MKDDRLQILCDFCQAKYSVDTSKIPISGKKLQCKHCSKPIIIMRSNDFYMESFSREIGSYIISRKQRKNINNLEYDIKRIIFFEKYLKNVQNRLSTADYSDITAFFLDVERKTSPEQVEGLKITLSDLYDTLFSLHIVEFNPMANRGSDELKMLYFVDDIFSNNTSYASYAKSNTIEPIPTSHSYRPAHDDSPMVECPYCKESIRPDALKCIHCKTIFDQSLNKIKNMHSIKDHWKSVFDIIQSFQISNIRLGVPSFVQNSQGIKLTPWLGTLSKSEGAGFRNKLPWRKGKIGIFSYWGFWFGPFYYMAKGMWKKGSVLFTIILLGSAILSYLHKGISLGILPAFWIGAMFKYDYYRKTILCENFWW